MRMWRLLLTSGSIMSVLFAMLGGSAAAATTSSGSVTSGNFNLQVTPSPLVSTVQPGTKTDLQIKIYNSSVTAESLTITDRSFTFNSSTGRVNLDNNGTALINPWLKFSAPTFTIQPGQWFPETLSLSLPKTAGFSYSFAIVISPQHAPQVDSGHAISGSLAVFALLNVNRPGATSNLKVVNFTTTKHLYQYLPATLNVRVQNAGNTILQPYGNIFISRNSSSKTPITTLTVNANKEYILPGTSRTMSAQWDTGFATYQTLKNPAGNTSQHMVVNWSKLSQFRIGEYTARLVAVYDDDGNDVPIEGSVSFWVIPWTAILVFVCLVVALWFLMHWRNKRRTEKAVKKALAAQAEVHKKVEQT